MLNPPCNKVGRKIDNCMWIQYLHKSTFIWEILKSSTCIFLHFTLIFVSRHCTDDCLDASKRCNGGPVCYHKRCTRVNALIENMMTLRKNCMGSRSKWFIVASYTISWKRRLHEQLHCVDHTNIYTEHLCAETYKWGDALESTTSIFLHVTVIFVSDHCIDNALNSPKRHNPVHTVYHINRWWKNQRSNKRNLLLVA